MAEKGQLMKKLVNIMKEVKHVPKRGYNEFHKYNYVTEADVVERVREELVKNNVLLIPSVEDYSVREIETRTGKAQIATVKISFSFIDADTGEGSFITMIGEGMDTGDKAIYKAITGAQKYVLMKTFLIPTGDDPELEELPQKPQSQSKKITIEQLLERIKAVEVNDEKYPGKNLVEIYDTNKEYVAFLAQNADKPEVRKAAQYLLKLKGDINEVSF